MHITSQSLFPSSGEHFEPGDAVIAKIVNWQKGSNFQLQIEMSDWGTVFEHADGKEHHHRKMEIWQALFSSSKRGMFLVPYIYIIILNYNNYSSPYVYVYSSIKKEIC